MKCRRCSGPTRVPVTRDVELGDAVIRVRECRSRACGYSFATEERPVNGPPPPIVEQNLTKRNRRAKAT